MNKTVRLPDTERLSLLAVANVILRYRWLVLRVTLGLVVATAAYLLLRPRTYSVSTTFRLQTRNNASSSLSGLAASLGVTVPAADATQSPAFYVDLLRSREILGAAVTHRYKGANEDLLEAYQVKGATAGIRRERAMAKLSDDMTVLASPRTGVITLSVTLLDPVLAQEVAQVLLDEVNAFNLESRKSQAGAERQFVGRRLEEVRWDLRAAEDRLQAFLQRNRDYRNSPELGFEQERRAREVSMQQAVFSSLAQSFEQAKIEEVRDTPVITVIDRPERPVLPDRRQLLKKLVIAAMLGIVFGLGIAFLREALASNRRTEAFEEFQELRQEALDDLKLRGRRRREPA